MSFFFFFTIWVLEFCHNFSFKVVKFWFFLVLSQFEFLSCHNSCSWVLSRFDFLSFVKIWVSEFCQNLYVLSFVTIWVLRFYPNSEGKKKYKKNYKYFFKKGAKICFVTTVTQATGLHFNLPRHSLADLSITAIEQVKKNDTIYRNKREELHIRRFNTFYNGLNRQV